VPQYPLPITITWPPWYAALLASMVLDSKYLSKLATFVTLPVVLPQVTTTLEDPSIRISAPTIAAMLESDCHTVALLAVHVARRPPV